MPAASSSPSAGTADVAPTPFSAAEANPPTARGSPVRSRRPRGGGIGGGGGRPVRLHLLPDHAAGLRRGAIGEPVDRQLVRPDAGGRRGGGDGRVIRRGRVDGQVQRRVVAGPGVVVR